MYISESDKTLIRQLIEKQLRAFQEDDCETAFALASPTIQSRFTPPDFVRALGSRYSAILKPRSFMFQSFTSVENFPALTALIMDRSGNLAKAIFVLQHQPDFSWRVHGYELIGVNERIV